MKTISITRKKAISAFESINTMKDKIVSPKVAYFYCRNLDILQKEITAIQEAQKTLQITPEIDAYNKKQQKLAEELGQGTAEYAEKSTQLYNENIDLINAYREKEKQFNDFLDESVEMDVATISVNDIPSDLFTANDYSNLFEFLEDFS